MLSILSVPKFIADTSSFDDWLNDFSDLWGSTWRQDPIGHFNPDYVSFVITADELLNYEMAENVAISLSKLQQMFPERWSGELVMKSIEMRDILELPSFEFESIKTKDGFIQYVTYILPLYKGRSGYEFTIRNKVSKEGKLISEELKYEPGGKKEIKI